MAQLQEVPIAPVSAERFRKVAAPEQLADFERIADETRARMAGRVWWNINSTARGGGVAEILRPQIAYGRGAGVDARWLVIHGTPSFFRVTKRLHHALHGSRGDGSALGEAERRIYEDMLHENADELLALVRRDDVVLLHDPQTAGLVPMLSWSGARIFWRCHVGTDEHNEEVERGWAFLRPYLAEVTYALFSRKTYVPSFLAEKSSIMLPAIDAFSPKNQPMTDEVARAILVNTGIIEGPPGDAAPLFVRSDGVTARVNRQADVVRMGRATRWDQPVVVQVSRWDRLKDPIGVMRGFARAIFQGVPNQPDLVLAGVNVNAVADDPEAAETFEEVLAAWRALPHYDRTRIHLVHLPLADVEENAAIVNALQRHATIVVQKSLQEGFGLTVTEAMWKGKPVIASAVGGIQDQIIDGEHGLLLRAPHDLDEFAGALRKLLGDPALRERLGKNAQARVREKFLGIRQLRDYGELLARADATMAQKERRPEPTFTPSPPQA